MSQDPDDPALIALGAAISDGASIDWGAAAQTAEGVGQQQLLRGLRDVAALVTAHRATHGPPMLPAGELAAPRHWQHLILFEPLGHGAFGTVYRGWDSRLEREVAVKLLPKSRTSSAPLTEARHLARVRHVNVVTVYGADQDEDQVGIWMEFIDGRTLGALVRDNGPLSAREMSGIGIDLCGALSALHAAGLLHRDIKPHNVMRELGGRTVLMDFSGAQPLAPGRGAQVMSGTPVYMAPELFDGGQATPASDVYSLGVLLFFLLTGAVPVDGATLEEVRRAHARRARKHLRDLRADLPEPVVQVIERATAPDRASRYRTAGELERGLAAAAGAQIISGDAASPNMAAGAVGDRRRPRVALGVAALATVLLALAGLAGADRWRAETRPMPMARFTVGPPYNSAAWPRLSPDGQQIIFGTIVGGRPRFWIRPLASAEGGRSLSNTTAQETPFWSPDSRTVAFFADQQLKLISADGGEYRVIAEASNPRGGDWSRDSILFSSTRAIWRVSPDGSQLKELTRIDASHGDYQNGWPRFLPDGVRFLYMIRSTDPERTGIYVGGTDGRPPRRLMAAYSRVTYANGYLLYVRDSSLIAHPFDEDRAELTGGAPVLIAERIKAHARGDAAFDVSAAGMLIYSHEAGHTQTRLTLVDRRGRKIREIAEVGEHRQPRFSPDGQRIVAETVSTDTQADVWTYGVAQKSALRLTRSGLNDVRPVWSSDGLRVAFSSRRGPHYRVFSKTVDGTGPEEPLRVPPGDVLVEHWSSDGLYLTATILRDGLWVIPISGAREPWRVHADARAGTFQSEFSPDGRWLAYMSEESGRPQVYVEPFPATTDRWQVSRVGGAEPHWRGQELIYLSPEGNLVSATRTGPGWREPRSRRLFPVSVRDHTDHNDYAVCPDGDHFVVNVFVADPVLPPIDVVVNWTTLVKK